MEKNLKASSDASNDDRDFISSELGTKKYWDTIYVRDIDNFNNSADDVGEIWFGESSQDRVIRWLEDCEDVTPEDPVLDLGCGNGMMLVEMHREGYRDLTGVDYSDKAVQLARNIADKEDMADMKYETADLTSDIQGSSQTCLCRQYKVCIDKGTYDAISLMPCDSLNARHMYKNNVKHLLTPGGMFIITSCNWTQDQLEGFFTPDFQLHTAIPTPTFQFGGQTGNSVTCLVFTLKS